MFCFVFFLVICQPIEKWVSVLLKWKTLLPFKTFGELFTTAIPISGTLGVARWKLSTSVWQGRSIINLLAINIFCATSSSQCELVCFLPVISQDKMYTTSKTLWKTHTEKFHNSWNTGALQPYFQKGTYTTPLENSWPVLQGTGIESNINSQRNKSSVILAIVWHCRWDSTL